MGTTCQVAGCKNDSPSALAEQKLCVLHFTLSLENSCAEMRRETALGNAPQERQREIMRFITEQGERLARVATSGLHLTDDLKARILSTFLTFDTGISILMAISSDDGSRPSSWTSEREVRINLLMVSIIWTGILIVRAWSAMARVMAWRIHHVA